MSLDALVFDAYGTLFDVHSVVSRCEQIWPGKGTAVSQLWRAKQLEYTWQRSLMDRYADFEHITADALRYACEFLKLECDETTVIALMAEYRRLATFPEVRSILNDLRDRKLAILSNGSPDMLADVVRHSGLDDVLDTVISVNDLQIYKPDRRVYQLALVKLNVPKQSIGFISSNGWDAFGAASFGFRAFWINRTNAPLDRLGTPPEAVITTLAELPSLLD